MKISVKVKPNARKEKIEKINETKFLIWVRVKPQEGKANKAVIKILAEFFGVSKSEVILLKGHTSREKVFAIKNRRGNHCS